MKEIKADVLVITAHPDDAEFGIAGSVARWIQEGKIVVYTVCTSGDKGTEDINLKPQKLARIREREQRAAAKILGVQQVVFLQYPDQGLEDTPEFRKQLVRLIRKYRPETVATSDPYRRYIAHRDHRIVGQVVLDAIFPFARDIHAYPGMPEEGLMPHKVKELLMWGSDDPNYCVDITATFEIKMKALACHKSQLGNRLAEREERLRERAKKMAEGQCFALAEAFHREEISP